MTGAYFGSIIGTRKFLDTYPFIIFCRGSMPVGEHARITYDRNRISSRLFIIPLS